MEVHSWPSVVIVKKVMMKFSPFLAALDYSAVTVVVGKEGEEEGYLLLLGEE